MSSPPMESLCDYPHMESSGSVSASPQPISPSGLTTVRRCYLGTSGPCQDKNGVCFGYLPGSTTCPNGSVAFYCPVCLPGTSGPCTTDGGECSSFADPVLHRCPSGSVQCYTDALSVPSTNHTCAPCGTGTTGRCQRPGSNICFGYVSSGSGQMRCPLGAVECSSFRAIQDPQPPTTDESDCAPCSCRLVDGTCAAYYPDTVICPTGSTDCHSGNESTLASQQVEEGGGALLSITGVEDTYGIQIVADNTLTATTVDLLCTASLETQPCATVGYVPGSFCLPLVVSLSSRSESRSANDVIQLVNATLTISLPEAVSLLLTNGTAIEMVSRLELQGSENASQCVVQVVNQYPATVMVRDCGPGSYVLLVRSNSTSTDSESMVRPSSVPIPSAKSSVPVVVVAVVVCSIVVAIVGVVAAFVWRQRSSMPVIPVKSLQRIVVTAPSSIPCGASSNDKRGADRQGSAGLSIGSFTSPSPPCRMNAWQVHPDLRDFQYSASLPEKSVLAVDAIRAPLTTSSTQQSGTCQLQPLSMPKHPSKRRRGSKHAGKRSSKLVSQTGSVGQVDLPSSVAGGPTAIDAGVIVFSQRAIRAGSSFAPALLQNDDIVRGIASGAIESGRQRRD